jgi:hypothetical protein
MMIGGWKTRSIFERYNIKSEDDLRDAAAAVAAGAIGKGLGKTPRTRPIGKARKAEDSS